MNRLVSLLVNDGKNAIRDDILPVVACIPVFLVLLIRFGEPQLQAVLPASIDLSVHHPAVIAVLTCMTPMMFGWVIGFMLLEEREEHVLSAIAITPLTKRGYLLYRITLVTVVSIVLTAVLIPLSGLSGISGLTMPRYLIISVMAALEAPFFALILATLAGNRVEGLAVAKLLGIIVIPPILPFYFDSPAVYLSGIIPSYWIGEALTRIDGPFPSFVGPVVVGFVLHFITLRGGLAYFSRRGD
ncbi:MAG: hypothetical protein WCY01_03635 [Alkalispirochaeta sp.]